MNKRRVLIRAVGPGLAAFGLTGLLAEPQLELYNGKSLLHATAGAWGLQPNADEIRGAFEGAGAFKLAEGSRDSAMVVTLLPGNWTVQVSGANGGTGVAIIEVYALPGAAPVKRSTFNAQLSTLKWGNDLRKLER